MRKKEEAIRKKRSASILPFTLNKKVWNDFQKFIAPSGISVSRMMEAIMRVACNPEAAAIWERICYAILKAVSEIQAREESKKSRKQ
jgi:hypothetical protein